jgi:hypothetical protein
MSMREVLATLETLKPTERQAVRLRLAELDDETWCDDGELSSPERMLLDQRLGAVEANPHAGSLWPAVEARLLRR